MESHFWVVCNFKGSAPSFRHATRQSARNEAKRLADYYPGQRFYVLHAESFAAKNEVLEVDLDCPTDDGVPF